MTHCIGVAQTRPVAGNVSANLREHLALAQLAATSELRPTLLLFPELSLTGYELELCPALAFDFEAIREDPRAVPLRAAAAQHDMTLIVGAPTKTVAGLHIGALIFAPDGSTTLYAKQQLGSFGSDALPDLQGHALPPAEASVFVPSTLGQLDPRVPIHAGASQFVALAICADAGRPTHLGAAHARGAQAYLASMFVVPSAHAREHEGLQARAREHGIALAVSNFGGPSGGLASAGRSGVYAPDGRPLAQLGPDDVGVAIMSQRSGESAGVCCYL